MLAVGPVMRMGPDYSLIVRRIAFDEDQFGLVMPVDV